MESAVSFALLSESVSVKVRVLVDCLGLTGKLLLDQIDGVGMYEDALVGRTVALKTQRTPGQLCFSKV